jgi:enoyl-CoA hydratase/carnithine racemase
VDDVVSERRGAVQILRINRPEARNALNPAVMRGLGEGLHHADTDAAVRAVVITGTGDRAFCAGMDLRAFADNEMDTGGLAAYQRFTRDSISKPVIGAANATAVGGGFELLLACDMVIASSEARFGLPEVKRGLFPGGGGVFLSRRIPLAVALELVLTGDTIDVARAEALGLVNHIVPPERVMDEAVALGERIGENGPLGLRAVKRLTIDALDLPRDEVWHRQEMVLPEVFGSNDAKEGARAFVEKRMPIWTGC